MAKQHRRKGDGAACSTTQKQNDEPRHTVLYFYLFSFFTLFTFCTFLPFHCFFSFSFFSSFPSWPSLPLCTFLPLYLSPFTLYPSPVTLHHIFLSPFSLCPLPFFLFFPLCFPYLSFCILFKILHLFFELFKPSIYLFLKSFSTSLNSLPLLSFAFDLFFNLFLNLFSLCYFS